MTYITVHIICIYIARSCCILPTPVWMPDASYFEGVRRRDRGPGLYRDEECPHCGGPGSPAGSALRGDHPVDPRRGNTAQRICGIQ